MSQPPKRGLGKGLNAILGDYESDDGLRKPIGYVNKEVLGAKARQNTADVLRIPVDLIQPNPYQPRQSFDQEALEELTASIRNLGLIQPITVRKAEDGKYQIISGERRFKACRLAGMSEVPAYIISTDDRGMMEMAIVENIQRENLDPIEIALSYRRLIDECSLTQEAMADRLGKKRASVANQLRLLNLPVKIQYDLKVGQISVGHAKVLLSVDDPKVQMQLCNLVVKNGLSVRQLEEKVHQVLEQAADGDDAARKGKRKAPELPQTHKNLGESLSRFFKSSPVIRRNEGGKGTITIKFSSDKEVETLLNAIEGK